MIRGSVGDYDGPDAPWNAPDADSKDVIITTTFFVPVPRGIRNLEEHWRSIYTGEVLSMALGLDYDGIYETLGELSEDHMDGIFNVLTFARDGEVYGASIIERDEDGPYEADFEVDDDDWMYRDIPDCTVERMKMTDRFGITWDADYEW